MADDTDEHRQPDGPSPDGAGSEQPCRDATPAEEPSKEGAGTTASAAPGSPPKPSPEEIAARELARFRKLRERAEAGDREAMYLLGVCFARGKGVEVDFAAAVEWFKKATVFGHLKAKLSLGYCYAAGKGVKRDLEVAYILLREAAEAGDHDAFELAERVAQRLHTEQLARCEKKIRQRRIMRKAQRGRAARDEEIEIESA